MRLKLRILERGQIVCRDSGWVKTQKREPNTIVSYTPSYIKKKKEMNTNRHSIRYLVFYFVRYSVINCLNQKCIQNSVFSMFCSGFLWLIF